MPSTSTETCTIRLGNHFADPISVLPSVPFQSDVFTEIGGITNSPHMGKHAQQDSLADLIKRKEFIEHTGAKNTITASRVGKRLVKAICYPISC